MELGPQRVPSPIEGGTIRRSFSARPPLLGPNMLRNLKAGAAREEFADDATKGGVRGLWLRVSPGTGPRTWVLRMRDGDGLTRRFTLGTFPALGLAEARAEARQMQQQVRHNRRDPVREGRTPRARVTVHGDGTLQGLVDRYYKDGRGAKLCTADEQQARILAVFAKIKDRALPALTADDLRQAVQAYPAKGAAGAAAAYLKALLRRLGEDDAHLLATLRPAQTP